MRLLPCDIKTIRLPRRGFKKHNHAQVEKTRAALQTKCAFITGIPIQTRGRRRHACRGDSFGDQATRKVSMTPEEFQKFYPHVIAWITQMLRAHAAAAKPVASFGFTRLSRYFSEALLASTKVVVVERVPKLPLSSMGLSRFAEFERGDYDGITYLDTFFVKRSSSAVERLYFHELIHVVQWRLLGPEIFLAAYAAGLEAFGYRDSPLEMMAYEAEASFARSAPPFDAEKLVAEQLGPIRDATRIK
jgi:hypothetical protein